MIFSFRAVLLVLGLTLLLPPTVSAAPASSLIPLNSWIYPALDKLAGLGLIESSLQGTRPYTRYEAARQVDEASLAAAERSTPAVVPELLNRLESELSEAIAEVRGDASPSGTFKPLRRLELAYRNRNGDGNSYPRTNARQFSLNTNNDGIDYATGSNGELRLAGDARLGSFLQFEWQPVVVVDKDESDLHWVNTRIAAQLGVVEISAGRQSLWWGQGRHGSLILTNNAQPLDMLRLTNPIPLQLPWILEYLGPFRFDVFWSRLEKDRVVPEPYFAGARLNFKPLTWLELGVFRTSMFGGDGRPTIDLTEFITVLGGDNKFSRGEDNGNSIAGFDWRLKMPFLAQTELYGEWGGEDQHDRWPTKNALLAGLYFPRLDADGRLALRLEYADLNYKGNGLGSGPVWYRHGTYQSGYAYEQKILGHHVGGDSRDYLAQLDWYASPSLQLAFSLDYEERETSRLSGAAIEKHLQPGLAARWQHSATSALTADFFYDRVENADFVEGADDRRHLVRLGLEMTF
ncbi:MAG: capsule assembly Wzi family protein [Desulfuromonadales bacterium]